MRDRSRQSIQQQQLLVHSSNQTPKKTFLVVAKKTFGSQTKAVLGCLYCRTEDQDRDLVENQREKPECLLRFLRPRTDQRKFRRRSSPHEEKYQRETQIELRRSRRLSWNGRPTRELKQRCCLTRKLIRPA
jgi:hypothetical protein